ncbi:uncharacterized protein VTP21DRAFT_6768 [Calcarisporiella thermophila]|uniref:uncharacterized protein n=1 Tax=Calcarisporiella thermophila TaxID=911321 RepID=UPI003743C2FC
MTQEISKSTKISTREKEASTISFPSHAPSFSSFPEDLAGPLTRVEKTPQFSSFPDIEKHKEPLLIEDSSRTRRSASPAERHKISRRKEKSKRHRDSATYYSSLSEEESSSPISGKESYSRGSESKSRQSRHHRHNRRSRSPEKRKRKRSRSRSRDGRKAKHELVEYNPPSTQRNNYFFDSRGDYNNIVYEGLNKYDIPRYYRAGRGSVLGLPSSWRITIASSKTGKGLEVVPIFHRQHVRYLDVKYQADDKSVKRMIVNPHSIIEKSSAFRENFIPLGDAKGTTEKEQSKRKEIIPAEEYRLVDIEIPGQEAESPNLENEESLDEYVKKRTRDYDIRLKEHPEDINLWLEFVAFQEEAADLQGGWRSSGKNASRSGRLALSEIKIAMFERALTLNPGNDQLLVAYLRECTEVLDTNSLLDKWIETLRAWPHRFILWMEYLNFRQTSFASFGVQTCLECFEQGLEVLREAAFRAHRENQMEELEGIEHNLLYVFLRACLLLKQAGYTERAYAAFQALIEMNFFRSTKYSQTPAKEQAELDVRLQEFEIFWESDVAHFGEKNAKGWRNFTEGDASIATTTATIAAIANKLHVDPLSEDANEVTSGFQTWADAESSLETSYLLPGRVNEDSTEEDDPYRIILFDDIRSLLFEVWLPEPRQHLIYMLLTFLALPFMPPNIPTTTQFTVDPFVHHEMSNEHVYANSFWPAFNGEGEKNIEYVHGIAMEPRREAGLKDPFGFPVRAFPATMETMFARRGHWFRVIDETDLKEVNVGFARNALTQLREVIKDNDLALQHLVLETLVSPKGSTKLAKSLLKIDRMNLMLWNGYAQSEKLKGNIDEARKVYATAISMHRSFPTEHQLDAPLLYRMFAELEFEQGRPNAALRILTMLTEESSQVGELMTQADVVAPLTSTVLKTRKTFTQLVASAFAPEQQELKLKRNALHYAISHALFEYLASGRQELDASLAVYDKALEFLSDYPQSVEAEQLLMARAHLIHRHSISGQAFQPRTMRSVLERSLEKFPRNTVFWGLYLSNEVRTRIENRVRRLIDQHLLKKNSSSFVGWLFAIYAEAHHALHLNQDALRSLFDRATDDPRARHSVGLWLLYLHFEARCGHYDRLPGVFYRAVRECPWSKKLYMFPLKNARWFSREILEEIYHLMLEKELRVRIPLERYITERFDLASKESGAVEET